MEFAEALSELGFRRSEGRAGRGLAQYTAEPNRYLTYSVHVYEDGTALFTWEYAIGEYLLTKGIQIGSDETLNQFMFPRQDERGPQDPAWLAACIDRAEAGLGSLRFDAPES